jgi:uncharacterized membrane protein YdjX (TVP38/TMEM64 family)
MSLAKRIWPVLLLMALVAAVRASGLQHYATLETLGQQQAALRAFVTAQPVIAPLAYAALYAAMVTLSIPGGAPMSVAGGVLFGLLPGAVYAVTGAEAGAVAAFLLARTVAGDFLTRRANGLLDRVRSGLQQNGFSYLLALRLLPIVPFWLTNLAAPLAGMRLVPYAAATLLGIIPATFVFVSLGAGLGDALATGERPDLGIVFTPRVLLPLLALAVLALVPVGWRRWRARHA